MSSTVFHRLSVQMKRTLRFITGEVLQQRESVDQNVLTGRKLSELSWPLHRKCMFPEASGRTRLTASQQFGGSPTALWQTPYKGPNEGNAGPGKAACGEGGIGRGGTVGSSRKVHGDLIARQDVEIGSCGKQSMVITLQHFKSSPCQQIKCIYLHHWWPGWRYAGG